MDPATGRLGGRLRIEVALVVALREGRVLVARREAGRHLAGLWEFPGGKVEPGEDPTTAARRELEEETGLVAGELSLLLTSSHDYAERAVRLHVFVATNATGSLRSTGADLVDWVTPQRLRQLEMPAANRAILDALERFRNGAGPADGD